MQRARIEDLLRLGPNEHIIFERDAQSPSTAALAIASLANSQGGVIVFGIGNNRRVYGTPNPDATRTIISRAADQIRPALLIDPQLVTLDNKQLVLLEVPQGYDTPYTTADGYIPMRNGKHIMPATSAQAAELARRALQGAALVPLAPGMDRNTQRLMPKSAPPTVDLEHVMLKLERLIIANADLARTLDEANSWRSRLTDQLVGAVLGLIVSTLVFYVLGIG